MQKYNKGDKVKTIDYWSNGRGTVIPKGSIVTVISDNGNMVFCDFKGLQALYEYEWLGEVVGDRIKTNADKIRSMKDEELAEKLIHKQDDKWICSDMEKFYTKEVAIVHELHWLQSEAEKGE